MWNWVLGIGGTLIGMALLVCLVGALLPRDHVAAAERVVAAPPERVAAMIREVEAYPRWRRGVTRVELLERGAASLRFTEHGKDGPMAFQLAEEVPGARFRSTIADPDLPFGGYWEIALAPDGMGTRVRIEEHGFVSNIVFRFLSTLVFGHEATMKAWLEDLDSGVSA
jgi:uncharacterized protein YndB with AHSA1/START domain